ncbi:MAG: GntR family transcriptional regulator [Oscillibacter sp.]|nr:GntR family transcriptional regulator [Oscillibacter sp.]
MKAVRLPKKPDSVVNALRDAILSGEIECGAELTQTGLAESLGVSRMPVREALLALEYQGLAERLSNQHLRVAEIDRSFFEDAFALGAELERRIIESRRSDFRELAEEMDFHRTAYRLTENRFLSRILETVAETYIAYAVRCPGYDTEAGLSDLQRVCVGNDTKTVLKAYFDRLTDVIMEARKK